MLSRSEIREKIVMRHYTTNALAMCWWVGVIQSKAVLSIKATTQTKQLESKLFLVQKNL
jgi:hypothetical protein